MVAREVQVFGPDDLGGCPTCGARASMGATEPCARDDAGEIFEAMCPEHGEFLWQVSDATTEAVLNETMRAVRHHVLIEAEKAIVARVASYPRDQRAGIASTHMAALVVRRLRTGETATVYAGFEVVPSELLDAFKGATASLAAAISLLERGGKKAAPSDTMFEQMLTDYRNALERARAAWRAHRGD